MKHLIDRLLSSFSRSSSVRHTAALDQSHLGSQKAEHVEDPSFKGWTFFDTCCISELVKLADAGEQERVSAFVRGHDVVIPHTILQEIRRATVLAHRVTEVLSSANLYLITHPTNFWECDIWNFPNTPGFRQNILEVVPMPSAMFHVLDLDTPMRASFERAERMAGQEFLQQIKRDRALGVDERMLVAMVWGKANELSMKRYKIKIPPADCRPENLPALFTYHYAYYFRYLAQRTVLPHPNDFIDLAHASVAPYSRVFYAERKLVQLLRQIKARTATAPTPYAVAKKMHKEGLVDSEAHERARLSDDMRRDTAPLLQTTELATHIEMREAVLAL